MRFKYKLKHYFFNKYILPLFTKDRFYVSYDYKHKAIWYRNAKVATRTIHNVLKNQSADGSYVYGLEAGFDVSKFSDFYKFAFVRNPESRLLSGWNDKVVHSNYFEFSAEQHHNMKTLGHFLEWLEQQDKKQLDKHFRLQHLLIEHAQLDFLGRFENFNADFEHVKNKIGLTHTEVPHLNKSKRETIKLNSEERDLIRKIYAEDYKLFYPELL